MKQLLNCGKRLSALFIGVLFMSTAQAQMPQLAVPSTTSTWETLERPKIVQNFERLMYGKLPEKKVDLSYKVLEESTQALEGKAVRRQVEMTIKSNGQERKALLLIYLPKDKQAVPGIVSLNFQGNATTYHDDAIIPSRGSVAERGNQAHRWPYKELVEQGYAVITAQYFDFYIDDNEHFSESILPLLGYASEQQVPDDGAAAIAAWAWGCSRMLDYALECEPQINPQRISVAGHSRIGKAAIWAGALDTRFYAVYSNDSGCCGATLTHRMKGEKLNDIVGTFPWWFARNLQAYKGRDAEMPIDQHQLLALIAPRPLYVASANEDLWADPEGEFLGAQAASPIYNLYGYEGLEHEKNPATDVPVYHRIGYHRRTGGHDINLFDWNSFVKFLEAQGD